MNNPTFRNGSFPLLLKETLIGSVPVLAVLSFILAGALWPRVSVLFLLVFLPLTLLVALIASLDRFSLDDDHQTVRKTVFYAVPYNRVKGFEITIAGVLSVVRVKTGAFQSYLLLQSMEATERERLLEELRKRFPENLIRVRTFETWKSTLIICAVLLAGYLLLENHLLKKYPAMAIQPQKIAAPATPPAGPRSGYDVRKVTVYLPERLACDTSKDTIVFLDTVTGLHIYPHEGISAVIAKAPPAVNLAVKAVFGSTGDTDLLRPIYQARHGLLPLTFKGVLTAAPRPIHVSEFRDSRIDGFLVERKNITDLTVTDHTLHRSISFLISGPPDAALLSILSHSLRP